MPTEVELKLALDPEAAASVGRLTLQHGVAEKPISRTLKSIYFDTPDADLRDLCRTLRLRRVGGAWVQMLKEEGAVAAGLHVREESEHPVRLATLDLEKIEDPRLRKQLSKWQGSGKLAPRFETLVRRSTWLLRTADGSLVECALDRGQVLAMEGRRSAPLCELELELKSGSPSALFALARELARSLPVALETRSKAERGYMLWRSELWRKPSRAGPLRFPDDATAGEALAQIVASGLTHLQRNWQAARAGSRYDPEHVHQMRVASRRLRTAFTLFSQIDGALKALPPIGELQWLAGLLGEARNWDVLLAETFPKLLATFPDEPALRVLERKARTRRQRARRTVGEALRSPRYFALVLSLSEFVMTIRERSALSLPAMPVAVNMLTLCDKQLRKRAKDLATCSAAERHAARIAAKRMRYTAEFFGSLFTGRKLDKFLRRFSTLQDALGLLNDLATTRGLMSALAVGEDPQEQHALGLCIGWSNGLEQGRLTDLARSWKTVKRTGRFWPDMDDKLDTVTEQTSIGPAAPQEALAR